MAALDLRAALHGAPERSTLALSVSVSSSGRRFTEVCVVAKVRPPGVAVGAFPASPGGVDPVGDGHTVFIEVDNTHQACA